MSATAEGANRGLPPGTMLSGLLEGGLLVETGVPGLYVRSDAYESLVEGVDRLVVETFASLRPVSLHFPPLLSRQTFSKTNYLESFPDLMGSVHVFRGGDGEHRELLRRVAERGDWQALLEPGDVVVASAACHGLYPLCTGRLPAEGRTYEVRGYCFRHEPSDDPARMQAFRMHELVFLGDPDAAASHRREGLSAGVGLLERLGLDIAVEPANDPFFGRLGKVLARQQHDSALKLEALTEIDAGRQTAVLSGNCHQEHFGTAFAIERADGGIAHSACVAFGVDRVALALLARHGLDLRAWPGAIAELVGARLP